MCPHRPSTGGPQIPRSQRLDAQRNRRCQWSVCSVPPIFADEPSASASKSSILSREAVRSIKVRPERIPFRIAGTESSSASIAVVGQPIAPTSPGGIVALWLSLPPTAARRWPCAQLRVPVLRAGEHDLPVVDYFHCAEKSNVRLPRRHPAAPHALFPFRCFGMVHRSNAALGTCVAQA